MQALKLAEEAKEGLIQKVVEEIGNVMKSYVTCSSFLFISCAFVLFVIYFHVHCFFSHVYAGCKRLWSCWTHNGRGVYIYTIQLQHMSNQDEKAIETVA